jgi:hypothetical protein
LEKLLTGENAVQVGKTWAAIFFSHTFAQKSRFFRMLDSQPKKDRLSPKSK